MIKIYHFEEGLDLKENKSIFLIFALLLSGVMILLFTTEKYSGQIELPEQNFNRSFDGESIVKKSKSDILNIFDKDSLIEFASEMFEHNGVRSGTTDISITGFTKEDFGVESSVINYTEVILEDGTRISFIEPETEVVDMYNKISVNDLIAVIVVDVDGNKIIVKPGQNNFEYYRQTLLKEKRSIQTTKLTNLEVLLAEAENIGGYYAYLINDKNRYSRIRSAQLYYNTKKNYMLMLSKNKQGTEFFLVDAGVDLCFDHIYEIGSEFLDVKGFVTADKLENKIYRTFMEMTDLNLSSFETEFQGVKLLIVKK